MPAATARRSGSRARPWKSTSATPKPSSTSIIPSATRARRKKRKRCAGCWRIDPVPREGTMVFSLGQLQQVIRDTYDVKDRRRGVEGTFMWFLEEVGELAAALRSGTPREREEEFADVLA